MVSWMDMARMHQGSLASDAARTAAPDNRLDGKVTYFFASYRTASVDSLLRVSA